MTWKLRAACLGSSHQAMRGILASMRTSLFPLLALPGFPLSEHEPLAQGFLALGLRSFEDAARYVWELPHGRNSDRADFRLVLPEGRGTCSTKHALLAALARAHGQPVHLTLGIYEMHERNTPGVGAVLEREGLSGIPEAHCYLVVHQRRVDLTRKEPPGGSIAALAVFFTEERIEPEDIGAPKEEKHRAFIRTWAARRKLDPERIWRVREACIAALGESR
ncbi:transglutaminase domain-containing protein [Archangium gephyra]|nr:transglutaminase domain-containing protein [Archangium gephyra]